MIQHCKNCSACCDVIAIDNMSHEQFHQKVKTGAVSAIHGEMMRPLSRDEAFKRNPLIVTAREERVFGENFTSYFTCTKLKDGMCSIYDQRPTMCSGYPFYNRVQVNVQSHIELCKTQMKQKDTPYSSRCTYVPTLIPIQQI